MMPEQIWDYADIPSAGMYLGRSAGSAQPLVWAHSEYVKLLRSVTDGRVFDRISAVEDRYAVPATQRTFSSQVEIFQTGRPITAFPQVSLCASSIPMPSRSYGPWITGQPLT